MLNNAFENGSSLPLIYIVSSLVGPRVVRKHVRFRLTFVLTSWIRFADAWRSA